MRNHVVGIVVLVGAVRAGIRGHQITVQASGGVVGLTNDTLVEGGRPLKTPKTRQLFPLQAT